VGRPSYDRLGSYHHPARRDPGDRLETGTVKDLEGMERLLSSDATPFERELLEESSRERPSAALVLAMQRGLGIGPGAPPLEQPRVEPLPHAPAAPPTAAPAAAGAWSSATLIKVAVGGALAAGAVVAALSLQSGPAEPALASPARNVVAAPPPEPAAPVVPPAPEAATRTPEASDPARELRLEIELLDRVRTALAAGEPERAHSLLDQYAARFPTGTLAREAEVLRGKVGRSRSKLPAAPEPATLEDTPNPARP
jgi:hypothetical protein